MMKYITRNTFLSRQYTIGGMNHQDQIPALPNEDEYFQCLNDWFIDSSPGSFVRVVCLSSMTFRCGTGDKWNKNQTKEQNLSLKII